MPFEKNLVMIVILIIMGTLASQATSRISYEASLAKKHEQWMAEHGRVYRNSTEKERRFAIFKKNAKFVEDFNNEGNKSYKLGINQFSDMTDEEFHKHHTGYRKPIDSNLTTSSQDTSFMYQSLSSDHIPASIDWREQGAVTFIRNQGRCNVCWAFAAVAAVEGIVKIKTGQLIPLSEQQLLECDKTKTVPSTSIYERLQVPRVPREGCQDGGITSAFNYIEQNGGIASQANYPYLSSSGEKWRNCSTRKETEHAAQITGFQSVPGSNYSALFKAVSIQPVSVGISGDGMEFRFFKGDGVFSGPCDHRHLTHAVTIIGYGTDEKTGLNYWLIKNSWGEAWGDKGYMKILRDGPKVSTAGVCGLAMEASYPVL